MKKLLLTADGRINRAKYWLAFLIYIAVSVISTVLFSILWQIIPGEYVDGQYSVEGVRAIPYIIIGLGTLVFYIWSGICVAIKRCHDRGRSGWFMLIQLIPLIGGIWFFIEAGLLRGTVGPNLYGPDPLDPNAAAA